MTDLQISQGPPGPPGTYPVPEGRARWRLQLLRRQFQGSPIYSAYVIGTIPGARSRRLETSLNNAATLSFSLDGRDPTAALAQELMTDVLAWRWDDQIGYDVPMFRGIVAQSQDTLSEQSNTVNFTCHDYYDMLSRRFLTAPLTYTQQDQDYIVANLVDRATTLAKAGTGPGPGGPGGAGAALNPGSYLPFFTAMVDPAGNSRAMSGTKRDRTYAEGSTTRELIDNLSQVAGGFDIDVLPYGWHSPATLNSVDFLRVWYPQRGVLRSWPELIYGSTIASLTRSVNSADYTNFWREIGQTNEGSPQLYAEAWNQDAVGGQAGAVGTWMSVDNASDVTQQTTLNEQASGNLNQSSILQPSYSLVMRPGAYSFGNPSIGDTVPLVIVAGRLKVNTLVRVLGITFDIGDDGQEDVTLTVGRFSTTFAQLLTEPARDINALARR